MAEFKEHKYASKVVEWFENRGWEVYKEVEGPKGDRIVDIYAVKGDPAKPKKAHAVEVKTSFSLRVLEQAWYWKRYATCSSVAVPEANSRRARKFGHRVCVKLGMGLFDVVEGDHGPLYARQKKTPQEKKLRPRRMPELYDEQKTSVAGTPDDKERWTGFDHTKVNLRELVEETHPNPIELHKAVSEIDHHYKNDDTAAARLKRIVRDKAVPGVDIMWRDATPLLFVRDN